MEKSVEKSEENDEKIEEILINDTKFYIWQSIYKNLYQHQQIGLKWLLGLFNKKEGALLCDEMGLGKTVTVISFLSCINSTLDQYEKQNIEIKHNTLKSLRNSETSHLLITPVTIMKQWKSELMAWDPEFFTYDNVWILHETADMATRERILERATKRRGILIVSYELVRIYAASFLMHEWSYIILDEGQKIKNPRAQISQVCQRLRGLNRIVLTGTPIQNDVKELWSLFDFACPGFLGDLNTFIKDFCGIIIQGSMANANDEQKDAANKCTCILRNLILPHILRRTRKEITFNKVEENKANSENPDFSSSLILPSKKEYVLYCTMGKEQGDLYKDYINFKSLKTMFANCYSSYSEGLFVGITHLRKLANHPDLLFGTDTKKFSFCKEIYGQSKEYRDYCSLLQKELNNYTESMEDVINEDEFSQNFESNMKRRAQARIAAKRWNLSFKFVLLEKMLKKWRKEGHKALIFAQTRKLLDVIEEFVKLPENDYTYLRLDGQTPVKQRMVIIDKFNHDQKVNLFLLTTKVGGVGINLIGATRVLIFEPDWNPMSDAQAKDRAVRIGQLKDVVIYRLILANCIEEKIYHRQIFKEFLAKKVLKDPFLEKVFSYKDLYDFFDREVADKSYPPATLIQKRKIDSEKSREDTTDVARLCLKDKYAKDLEKDIEEAKKLKENQEANPNEVSDIPALSQPKAGRKIRKKVKTLRQKEQEVLAKVFAVQDVPETVPVAFGKEKEDEKCDTKVSGKLAEKIIEKFEESRIKRATALKQNVETGFLISTLEEQKVQSEEGKDKDFLRESLRNYLEINKDIKTEEIMDYFDKNFKQEQFAEFKAILQNIAKLSPENHTWTLK